MRADVKVHFKVDKNNLDVLVLANAVNLVSTVVKRVIEERYGSAETFDGVTGEPTYTGAFPKSAAKSISHVAVQSPQAMLAILQHDFSDPDMVCFTSVMPVFDSADVEDDDE